MFLGMKMVELQLVSNQEVQTGLPKAKQPKKPPLRVNL